MKIGEEEDERRTRGGQEENERRREEENRRTRGEKEDERRTFSISQTEILPAHMVINILDMPIPLQRWFERIMR